MLPIRAVVCSKIKSTLKVRRCCLATDTPLVGFIGLGNMGREMAGHLINRGKKLVVYDISMDAMSSLQGASIAKSPSDVASRCDRIFTMVPTGTHLLEIYQGQDGILSMVKPGTLLVDCSTVGPDTSQTVAKLAEANGACFMDAAVSGAVPAAKAASLTFMVGGKDTEIEAIKELLLCMGKNVIHTGDVGTGVTAKICNNMLLGITMAGTAETLNLARKLGLDPKLMTKIINISSGRSWSSEIYNPVPGVMENVPAAKNYKGGFKTELITKDLGLAHGVATKSNSPIPLGSAASQLYRIMMAEGYATQDFSSIYKFLKGEESKE